MQKLSESPSGSKNFHWLDIVETLSVLGSIGGSIASVVSQQVVFTSIPLSLAVGLNLINRRRLLDSIDQSNQTTIAQLTQKNVGTQTELGTLTEQLAQAQQLTTDLGQGQGTSNLAIAQLQEENVGTQAKLGTLTEQLAQAQQLTTDLGLGTSNLQDYIQVLRREQTEIADMVDCLQEIEICTQNIRINPNDTKAYYNRGLTYQHLENKAAAIGDYTEAVRINPSYAEAYRDRGLARADLGNRKGAVEDLREAAKLFFEAGNIANYQMARDLSKEFHELSSQSRTDAPEEVAVEYLFS